MNDFKGDFGNYIIEEYLRERNQDYRSIYVTLLKERENYCIEIVKRLQNACKSDEVISKSSTLDLVLSLSSLLGALLHDISTNSESSIDPISLAEETLKTICCFLSDSIEFRESITEIIKSRILDD
jgi:hypothetical protein